MRRMLSKPSSLGLALILGGGFVPAQAQSAPPPPKADSDGQLLLDLMELLNTPVISASKTTEKLSEAPATMIVVTRDDFEKRGYTQLSEILDDLPGMEVVRPFGDTHLKDYWRGYRNTIGEPFLVMVDGIVFNHLYYNTCDTPLVTLPISNVDRVEVVYGPASSVYGANAFMGVINVITAKDRAREGSSQRAMLTAGTMARRVVDGNYFYKKGDFRLSFTYRADNGMVDNETSENYEFTRNHYYADARIWGPFVQNRNFGGAFESKWRNRAFDVRAFFGNTEVGYQYLLLDTGYGLVYPGDYAQNNSIWARPETSFYLRHTQEVTDWLTSTTLIRQRESDVRRDSYFVWGTTASASDYPDRAGERYADFSYWQTLNSSQLLTQDFDLRLSPTLSATVGFKYERKDLQKAYDSPYGEDVFAWDQTSLKNYRFPAPPADSPDYKNRIVTEDKGVFAQLKWRFLESHQVNLGVRSDSNSVFGASTTIRAGYVGSLGSWGFKALYGEAYQEPVPRTLYGGWKGSGSEPDLKPEKSRTIELSSSYTTRSYAGTLSFWVVKNTDTIVTQKPGADGSKGAKNLGEMNVQGVDLHFQSLWKIPGMKQLKLWAFYSHYFKTDEEKFQYTGGQYVRTGTGDIGDLAKDKLWLGATAVWTDHVDLTLRARYVSRRDTVQSNPIRSVDGFLTLDLTANATYHGLGFGLKVTNLTNKAYFHPGIRSAAAGDTPGVFDTAGRYYSGGSKDGFNSLLPQPGRAILASIRMNF